MKIALLTDGIYPYVIGGMQKHSFYLAKYFAKNEVTVDLYFTADVEPTKIDCFSKQELKYINPIFIHYPNVRKYPGHYIIEQKKYSERILEQFLKLPSPDFIYIQGFSGISLLQSKLKIKIPTGINFHGLEMFQKAADLKSNLQQLVFKYTVLKCLNRADVVFSLGGKLTQLLLEKGVKQSKIISIPIGIDESWLKNTASEKNIPLNFLFIGRYERRKGIEELNSVINRINTKVDFNFEFIGPIPSQKQIDANNVVYHGAIKDTDKIREIVLRADVLVCPSYSEGMPTVILEAMSCGLAIIASDVGAVSEQVSKKNGILIAPGSATQLENAIMEMCNMESDKLLSMKQESVKLVTQKFLWDKVIHETIKKIGEVINKNS